MNIKDDIKEIFELQQKRDSLLSEIEVLSQSEKSLEEKITQKRQDLLLLMEKSGEKSAKFDGLVAAVFETKNVGYTDEKKVQEFLKENYSHLIRVKTTESIDKVNLKKELKTNSELSEKLSGMTSEQITKYVVVTDEEKYNEMMKHILHE